MIVPLGKELDEIFEVLDLKKDDVTKEQAMQVMGTLVEVLSKGMMTERDRIINILQRHAINPQDLVREIRKPIR